MDHNDILRFTSLFRGNGRSMGRFFPGKKSAKAMMTEHRQFSVDDFEQHLRGEVGIGIVPIMDDGYCWFGAIDIDAHGDQPDIDLVALENTIRELDLPLTACRSKSGGAHLYLFGNEPIRASIIRQTLAKWAVQLGFGGCEVFPKQDHLPFSKDDEGKDVQQLGNWLNICWFDAESDDCLRYTIEGGKRIPFHYFLDVAEGRRVSGSMLVEKGEDQHREAPPCVQRMIAEGVGKGHRNEAMYNMVIYLKQAFPETYRDKAFDMNARIFTEPMSHSEAKKVISSASRRDYRYKCKEEPCKSLCKSFECVNRKFGITAEEKGELEMGKAPEFGPLEKYMTNPVRWRLMVDGVGMNLTTPQLMDFRAVREAIADNLTKLVPPMKNDRWQVMLYAMMQDATLIEAPEEATLEGNLMHRLQEFFRRTDLESDGTNTEDREQLLTGSPVVQLATSGEGRVVYFRGSDFMDYLKKNRAEDVKGPNLWVLMRDAGVQHGKLRVKGASIQVWWLPLEDEAMPVREPKEVRSEF